MEKKSDVGDEAREVEINESVEEETTEADKQRFKNMSKKELVKEIESLEAEIKALEEANAEQNEKVLRIHAETENFKKRLEREKEDFVRYSNEKVIKELLPVVDNLERAVAHARESGETGGFLEGVEMTLNMFHQALGSVGVSALSSVGETFDPEKHEAVQQIESDDHEPNMVVSEFQKGYMLHKRLIRPAMVVVSSASDKKNKDNIQKGENK